MRRKPTRKSSFSALKSQRLRSKMGKIGQKLLLAVAEIVCASFYLLNGVRILR